LLAPPGDAAALAQCLRELLTDPARRATLGKSAAAFVAEARSVEAAAARLAQGLARVAAGATKT